MKSKSSIAIATGATLCAVLFLLSSRCVAQVQSQSRQLQQIEPVKSWPSKAKRWALVIGVDKYRDPQISPLKGSDNDARMLADALVRYAGFPSDQVVLMSTDQPEERQPSRVNILRRLSNFASVVPKDGLLVVSFAGHGMERNGQAFLLPSDAQISEDVSFLEETAVSVSRIKDRIRATGVGQVIFLLDACRNDPGGRADAPNQLTQGYVNAFNFDVRNREVQAFATFYATAVGQRAYEYTERKQGYFTWAIVEGLKGAAANQKGEVTLAGLVSYVQATVPKRIGIDLGAGKQQRPFAIIEGYRADDLVIAVAGQVAAVPETTAPGVAPPTDASAVELAYWDSIKNSNDPADFKSYLEQYSSGKFVPLARNRLTMLDRTNSTSSPPLPKPAEPGDSDTASEKAALAHLKRAYQQWLTMDGGYIVTREERRAFLRLASDEEREGFIEQFWRRRDPTPGTDLNEFREEYYARIAFANEKFSGDLPGWRTARGRIYITLGPPDEIRKGSPREVWYYRHTASYGNNVEVEFTSGSGSDAFQVRKAP